jgi:hypothetical protein
VPADGVALTKVYPEGKTSFTVTPVAALGPLFFAVRVKVTFVPALGEALLTVFVIERSAAPTGTVVAVPVLFPGVGSV